jgi:outer membrane receptor protein involved in Fe transport
LSPRAAVVFRPWLDHSFRLGYGLAFRKPSYLESQLHFQVHNYNLATPEILNFMATQLANEGLGNEKVHSIEAGWRGRFLGQRLLLSVDLFYNVYIDRVYLHKELDLRGGLPDLRNAIDQFRNMKDKFDALGGEAELFWHATKRWTFWFNLGLRRVTNLDSGKAQKTEPILRFNLGARYLPETGPFADVSLHYVSRYDTDMHDPVNALEPNVYIPVGSRTLMIGRAGYRMRPADGCQMEVGLTVLAPLGAPYREDAGETLPPGLQKYSSADYRGEMLVRLVSLYLRSSF